MSVEPEPTDASVSGTLIHMERKVRVIGFHAPRVKNPELEDPVGGETTSDSNGNWSKNLPVGGSFRVSINRRCWAKAKYKGQWHDPLPVDGLMTGVELCPGCEWT